MRLWGIFIAFFLFSMVLLGQNSGKRGIEVSDLKKDVAPCVDFYEYANGSWRAANPIPPSMQRWSRRWAAGESAKDRLRDILVEISAKPNHPKGSIEQLTGDFYCACMDEAQANKLGVTPIQPQLAAIDRLKTTADVQKMIARFHEMGIGVPFLVTGDSDNHDPNRVIIQLYASGLGLPDRDYYLKPEPRFKEAREKYQLHIAKIFALAGADEAAAQNAAETVFKLELKLAEVSLDNVALRDPQATDHKTTFAALRKLTPNFNWNLYYQHFGLRPADLNVAEPKFMEGFNQLLTAKMVPDWKTYLKWHLLNAAADSLSRDFVQEDFAFNEAYLNGAKEIKPRWKRCVEATDRLLGEALGRKYVEKYFPPEAKARMLEMVKNLSAAMNETIRGLDWMSETTKQKALEKLSTFNPKIGYPDKWKDYSRVPISRTDLWGNVMAGRKFAVRDNRSTIGKPVDRGRWGLTPPTSDAYYNPSLNEIVFPAGILQPPAFSLEAVDAVNYGAIGVVIGHEFSHGFDDQGAQYDAQGRLKNWWTDEDLKKFQAKTKCVADQFEGYFVEPGLHHNGQLVLGESIADLAGAKLAFRALQISRRGKPALPPIDGFTTEQQFFIAWGQFRGDAIRPELARTMIQGDPHPIAKYRVIGPLSNMPEFHQTFSCQNGAPMVRPAEQRCEVW